MRAMEPSARGTAADTAVRLDYYAHIAEPPGPTITVIEDLDPVAGYGAWWGEVNSNVHRGLGSLGVITNGSVRDLDEIPDDFHLLAGMAGPSHAWVRIEEFAIPVTVHGMRVEPGDLIHADRHGAVVIPPGAAAAIPAAAAAIAAQERLLIDASREPGFSADHIRDLLGGDTGH
jgi:regulator of RNase E activity RraA